MNITFTFIAILLLYLVICLTACEVENNKTSENNATNNAVAPNQQKNRKLILIWGQQQLWNSQQQPKEGEQVGNCFVTYEPKYIHNAAAVVFYHDALDTYRMPWWHYRDEDQLFVWYTNFNPWIFIHPLKKDFTRYNNFFNWTMSYRKDSDIFMPRILYKTFGFWMQITSQDIKDHFLFVKNRFALWLPPFHNETIGCRMATQYAHSMIEAGLDLDICGEGHLGDVCIKSEISFTDAMKYKFVLSFEINQHCKDYVTQTFWNALVYHAIPVVWGAKKEDLLHLVPPGSFIHTDDFDSPASLTKYLMYLDKNDVAYRNYFDWHNHPEKFPPSLKNLYNSGYAQLCTKATQNTDKKTINISEFLKADHKECLDADNNFQAHEEL